MDEGKVLTQMEDCARLCSRLIESLRADRRVNNGRESIMVTVIIDDYTFPSLRRQTINQYI